MLNKENSSGWNERTLDKEKNNNNKPTLLKKTHKEEGALKKVIKGNCIDKYNTNLMGVFFLATLKDN